MSQTRILIVEDEAIVARDIAQHLTLFGYQPVGQTPRGEQALVLVEQLRPDLVLMDIQLAGEMDGISAAQAIHDRFAIPVVFLTAFVGDETLERAKVTEPFGYIIKPFQDRELRPVIEMALYKHEAEARLRDAKNYTDNIIRSMDDMLVVLSPDGTIATVNKATCDLLGYSEHELLGQPATLLFEDEEEEDDDDDDDEDTLQSILAHYPLPVKRTVLRRLVKEGSVSNVEKSLRTKGGIRIPVSLSGSIMRDNGGEIRGIVCLGLDITDRKRMEDSLRGAEQFLHSTFDAMSSHIAILDEDGRIIAVNEAWRTFARSNGVDPRRVCEGANYLQTCDQAIGEDAEEARSVAKGIRAVLCGEREKYSSEYPCHSPHEKRWFSLRVTRFSADDPPRAVVVHDTITERKLAEEEVQRSEMLLRAVTDGIPDPIFLKDRDGRMLFANPATLAVIGKPREAVIGKMDAEYFDDPVSGDALMNNDRRIMETGQPQSIEEIVPGPGGPRTFLSTKSPFRDGQGRVAGIVGVARDITDRKREEDALRQREAELAQLSRVHVVGEMAAALAHELNQPLFAISNYVGGIESRLRQMDSLPGSKEIISAIMSVSSEVNRAAAIIARLREFVRGRDVHRSSVDIFQSVQHVIALMEPLARGKGVVLTTQTSKGLPIIQADPIQLEQVIVNLVANAIDAVAELPEPQRRVTIDAHLSAAGAVEVVVKDGGRGVPPELRDTLFEAFVSTKKDGLGVGLTISRTIIHAHGGKIWIVHHEPHGTSAHFTVPLAHMETEAQHAD